MNMAKGRLIDAMESSIFICGMAPLDHDDPYYNIFLCDPSQDCDSPLEPEFYVSKIQPKRLELCCHCAGGFDSPIDLNPSLKAPDGPYRLVLPICKQCYDNGCSIIVRGSHQNARAKRTRLDAGKRLEAQREEDVDAEGMQHEDAVLPASEEPAPTQTKRKTRATRKRATPKRASKRSKVNASSKP
jgi:hypothetical protein